MWYSYSGNFGYGHDLEAILEVAARVDNPNVLFLFVGDGDKKRILEDTIRIKGLSNCRMLPFQAATMLPYSLSSADLAIVTMGRGSSQLIVPSKIYNLMSVGAPLLCIADADSEISDLVNRYDIGTCFGRQQLDQAVDYINRLAGSDEECKRLQGNSLKASMDFTPEIARRYVISENLHHNDA